MNIELLLKESEARLRDHAEQIKRCQFEGQQLQLEYVRTEGEIRALKRLLKTEKKEGA